MILLLLVACGEAPSKHSPNLSWRPMLDAGELPDGVQVFAGIDDRLPLRAWYVSASISDPQIQARVIISDDTDGTDSPSEVARATGASVVVNAGYFRRDLDPVIPVGLVQIEDQLVHAATPYVERGGLVFKIARAALGFTDQGMVDVAWVFCRNDSVFEVRIPPQHNPESIDTDLDFSTAGSLWNVRDAVAGGPALIANGQINVTVDEEAFFGTSIPSIHPRTAAGYTADGTLILLIVDGRQDESRGVNLVQLAQIMHSLGCMEALNLDGGGSSALVVNGVLVNRPAGGTTEREVATVIAISGR